MLVFLVFLSFLFSIFYVLLSIIDHLFFIIMAKFKLTKGELKRQRDALGQFLRYLPTLQLKKQQLQMKVFELRGKKERQQKALTSAEHAVLRWAGLLADPAVKKTGNQGALVFDMKKYVLPSEVRTRQENIAGVYVPVLEDVVFPPEDYDMFETPFWVDRGVEALRELVRLSIVLQVIEEEIRALEQELRTTSQRVNLFEKVKIPDCQEAIRKIMIYLGDQQANAVGISKVAKKKIELAAVGG
jgi:V/A-type H+-transporting ATPase subunit D